MASSRQDRQSSGVFHPCLESPENGVPLGAARLTDRLRAAVLLQAAGLLSLLERAGWHVSGWEGACVAPGGRLAVDGSAAPGRSTRPPQDLLRELTEILFGGGAVDGRGEARRAVRSLLDLWRQSLAPVSPDEAVSQILEAAPFLWRPDLALARQALGGELPSRGPGLHRLWVAGPRSFRQALLARVGSAGELDQLLAGPEARSLWNQEEEGLPRDLAAAGRWRAALAAWERRPPESDEERTERAAALASLGRFEAALEALEGLGSPAARTLAAHCQLDLGQLGAARASLRILEDLPLRPEQVADLAEIAARVQANRGEPGRAGFWIRRALDETETDPPAALRTRLAAAGAAWDRRDFAAMDLFLEQARPALRNPDLAWRWHQLRALQARSAGALDSAVEHASRALRAGRRRLTRRQAAGLWNDLGFARAGSGHLPGAERAFLHAARLEAGCDGPRKATLALFNLAEIRLRRGRLAGVREIIARSEEENRRSGNLRGLSEDAGLWARFELTAGRPAAALAVCREALRDLERRGHSWYRDELHLFAARALGWLGRSEEAARELAAVPAAVLGELEPEERPALRAHAGDREGALAEAAGTPFAPLWQRLLAGEAAPAPAWESLSFLDPWRAARLVLDAEVLVPGAAPAPWRRAAAALFRRLGAGWPADLLEARDGGAWAILAAYLDRERGGPEALAELLAAAGHPEAELALARDGELQVLVAGEGGAAELATELDGGRLTLRARQESPALRAVLALARRDLEPAVPSPATRPEPAAGGLVGESPGLRAALERIARLAPGELPVLILGESGTGKELAARQLHRASARSRGPFVAVNCAALSETLLLSDLFGHARGAFTGADRDRKGVFETAHGGTVFLDEIGDLPLPAQGMLLRVLQEGEVRRLGESEPRRVNVRVLAATHRDLARGVDEGSFRRDLYYRLRVGSVELPPLRDRGDDVLRLTEHFLSRMPGAPALAAGARGRLLAHRWPGNVRELLNILSLASALAGGSRIEAEHLELPAADREPAAPFHQQIETLRRRLITEALEECGGRRAEAARRLGLSPQNVSHFARKYGLGDRGRPAG